MARLPPFLGAGFLPPVTQTPAVRPTATPAAPSPVRRAAVLAAAGALGLLAGFGLGDGTPLVVLGTAGLRLRGLPEFVTPDRGVGLMTLLGAVHATLVAYGWGLLAASVARRLRGWGTVAALAVVALVLTLVDPFLPAVLRLGAGAPSAGERALCALVVAAMAGLGTRLSPRRVAERVPADERRRDAPHAIAADADVTDLRQIEQVEQIDRIEQRDASDATARALPTGRPHATSSPDAPRDVALDAPRAVPPDLRADVPDDGSRPVRAERPGE